MINIDINTKISGGIRKTGVRLKIGFWWGKWDSGGNGTVGETGQWGNGDSTVSFSHKAKQ